MYLSEQSGPSSTVNVRPARIKVGGVVVERPALSGIEHLEFPDVGTLEAFHTDGLRSLLDTCDCPSMDEKTMRYPGHADRMRLLRETGFLSTKEVIVNGNKIVPRDLTMHLLEPAWAMTDDTALRFGVC